jgi:cytochrome P450 family 709
MAFLVPLFVVDLLVVAATWLWDYAIVRLIWRPYSIYKEFREQGIHGPPYKFIKGSKEDIKIMREQKDNFVLDVRNHNYLPRIAPHYLKWRSQYGKPYLLFFFSQRPLFLYLYHFSFDMFLGNRKEGSLRET